MNYELTIPIATRQHKVFLQGGFYNPTDLTANIHMHNYAEIHIIAHGSITFTVDDCVRQIEGGSGFIVPPHCFHGCLSKEERTRHTAFQIDYPCTDFAVHPIPEDVLDSFIKIIAQSNTDSDHTEIAAYIAFLASPFCRAEPINARRISDYGFLIHEFFTHRYGEDLRLADLAEELHLSERQAERLVLEHTGHTFREQLTKTRLMMAERLMKTTDLSLTKIAHYVGYRSYAGFWKAIKKGL